jgi:hypothetical protein
MKSFLAWITSTCGVYAILYAIWTYAEAWQLGVTHVSIVDTVICLIISMIIGGILTADIP